MIVGYDGTSMTNTASFIDTPNGGEGGIWMSNGASLQTQTVTSTPWAAMGRSTQTAAVPTMAIPQ